MPRYQSKVEIGTWVFVPEDVQQEIAVQIHTSFSLSQGIKEGGWIFSEDWAIVLPQPPQLIDIRPVVLTGCRVAGDLVYYRRPLATNYKGEEVMVTLPDGSTLARTPTDPERLDVPIPAVLEISGSFLHERDNSFPECRLDTCRPFRRLANVFFQQRHGSTPLG